jgi:hypothetical protein
MAVHTPSRRIRTCQHVDHQSEIKSNSPLLLSPTGTVSTASSPGTNDDIWGSPLPSSHHRSSAYSDVTLTPLTPLSACDASPDSTPVSRAYKTSLVECVEEGVARDAVATLNASYLAETNLRIDATQNEDYFFKPPKLIRNLTKELQASELQYPLTSCRAKLIHPRQSRIPMPP